MPLVAIGSAKGSPGVTTLALAVALALPVRAPRLVIEIDPDGGSIAGRRHLGYQPGLVELATALRRDSAPGVNASDFAQPIGDDVGVIPGPPSPEQAHAALTAAGPAMAAALASDPSTVGLIDLGRVSSRAPSLEFSRRATVTLLLTRPVIEDIAHLSSRIETLLRSGSNPELVVLGDAPYEPQEIASHHGVPLFAPWTDDRSAASAFWATGPGRSVKRSPWWRSTTAIAERIAARVQPDLVVPMPPALGSIEALS